MCVAKLTQFILYYYASFKHLRLNNSTKTFWKGRPAFNLGDKRPYFGACRQPLRDSKPEASRTGRRKPRLTRFLGLAWPRKASI